MYLAAKSCSLPLRTGFAVLLFLHNAPPYVPIGEHGKLVGSSVSLLASLLYDVPDIGHEPVRRHGVLL